MSAGRDCVILTLKMEALQNVMCKQSTEVLAFILWSHCAGVVGGSLCVLSTPSAWHLHPLRLIHHVNRSAGRPVFALRGEPPI